jgi:hypothetical protein
VTIASIDELLRHEEDPPRPQRRAGHAGRRLFKDALKAAALTAVIVVGLRAFGLAAPYPLVFGGLLALFGLRRVLGQVAPPPPPRAAGERRDDASGWPKPDSMSLAVSRWETRFDWARTDPGRFARIVQAPIAEILDERLRQRHGLTRATDPARARALLGEALWTFLETPANRPPTPRELAAVLTAMEQI